MSHTDEVTLHDLHPAADSIREDVLEGLSARPKHLPPKYFYDARGASLFERITTLDEYYPTRTELDILDTHADEMADAIGPDVHLIEFGSGSGLKTRLLLRALHSPSAYSPVDISRRQLVDFAADIARECPDLQVLPVCADYTSEMSLPEPDARPARRVAFFPGSSIGNFRPPHATAFLRRVRNLCGSAGALLIGVDLDKDPAILERAYNDDDGVTAAFNLNMLIRLNRDVGTDFDTAAFRHEAFYDAERQRIEMRLLCTQASRVTIPDPAGESPEIFELDIGDHITTEYSYKYSRSGFQEMAQEAGWKSARFWTDARSWFGIWLLEAG